MKRIRKVIVISAHLLRETIALAFILAPLANTLLAQDRLLISEIMYHPVERPAFDTNGVPLLDISDDVHEFV